LSLDNPWKLDLYKTKRRSSITAWWKSNLKIRRSYGGLLCFNNNGGFSDRRAKKPNNINKFNYRID